MLKSFYLLFTLQASEELLILVILIFNFFKINTII